MTTHRADECLDAARVLGRVLARALRGEDRGALLLGISANDLMPNIASIARQEFLGKHEDDVRGTGYVVQCLEAALWCFMTTDSFEAAVLRAANLGDDADTTAAVCGQIAGAVYGESGIPTSWLERLCMAHRIRSLSDSLAANTCDVAT